MGQEATVRTGHTPWKMIQQLKEQVSHALSNLSESHMPGAK